MIHTPSICLSALQGALASARFPFSGETVSKRNRAIRQSPPPVRDWPPQLFSAISTQRAKDFRILEKSSVPLIDQSLLRVKAFFKDQVDVVKTRRTVRSSYPLTCEAEWSCRFQPLRSRLSNPCVRGSRKERWRKPPQKSEWCKRNEDEDNVKGTLSKIEIIIDGSFSVQLPQSRMITASRPGSIRYLPKYIDR
jgi:hypothetical protein